MDIQQSNHIDVTIPPDWQGKTVESFLRFYLHLSRTAIRSLKKNDGITLDGVKVFVKQLLYGGEELLLQFPESVPQSFAAVNIPLKIIYEDSDLIVINKAAGMVVHPTKKHQNDTLANALLYHWSECDTTASFHPVHRLDRLTSGLILIAKNAWAHQQLDLQIAANRIHRLYLAVCQGVPEESSMKIDAPIEAFIETPKREVTENGKKAFTRYRVLRHSPAASLVAVKLFTGRTHQIRVHFSFIAHPLWGDTLYGSTELNFPRPALHAALLSFIHPRTGRRLRFKAGLPDDIKKLLLHIQLS